MSDTEKEITESIGKLTAEIVSTREQVAVLEKEHKATGEKMDEHRRISEDLAKDVVKKQDLEALRGEIDKIEARFERAKLTEDKLGINNTLHTASLMDIAGHGLDESKCGKETREFFASPEYRTLNETTDSEGGYLVTPEMDRVMLKNITQVDPMRTICRVQPCNSDSMEIDKETSGLTAYWVDEESSATESTPAVGKWDIKLHGLGVLTKATRAWLMDTYMNADAWISESAGIAMGYKEGVAFVEGNGVGQPLGFMTGHGTDAALYPADVSGKGTAVLDPSDFSELIGALKREYWQFSTFVMNQNTLVDTMQLTQDSKFIWQPGLQGGFPATILGRPFAIMPTMPDQSDGSYPVAFGDFMRGYRILDRMSTLLVKDSTSAAIFPKVAFNFLRRVGGRVVLPEAIKILEVT